MPVSVDRRAFLAQEYREALAIDTSVLTAQPLATQTVEATGLVAASDATTEATRRLTLRKVVRDFFDITVPLTPQTAAIDLGQVVSLTHSRFGLSAGASFVVIGIATDAQSGTITFSLFR